MTTPLQEIINQRAEKRLNLELGKICEFIRNSPIFSSTDSEVPNDLYYPKKTANDAIVYEKKKPLWFFYYTTDYMEKLKAYWLPIYIKEETEAFVNRVDELKQDVDELMSVNTHNDY